MTRFLVTGAAGFIGAHVVRRLASRGETAVLVRPGSRLERLASCRERLTILEADLADAAAVRRVVEQAQPDAVVHLAAAGVVTGLSAAQVVEGNLLGTYHLLAALRDTASARRVVLAGSWYEYGQVLTGASKRVPAPTSPYGISKLAATLLALEFAAAGAVTCVVLRPFQVYGPDEPAHRLIPLVLRSALEGRRLPLENPDVFRDWVYVDDVARAFEAAVDCEASGAPAIDIGAGHATSVRDVVRRVETLAGMPADDTFRGRAYSPSADARLSGAADTGEASRRLGWTATTPLDEGLRLTVQRFLQMSAHRA